MANKTSKPTGLSIARNGWKYTFSWKIAGPDYGKGQTFQWRVNGGKWITVSVGAATTSKAITIDSSKYYPTKTTKLNSVSFRVRGMRKPVTASGKTTTYGWSDYSTATKTIGLPNNPSISTELTYSNVTVFSWSVTTDTQDAKPFVNVEWQTRLVKASDVTDGSKLSWKSSALEWATGTGSASGSRTQPEDSTLLAADSYTRWFRIRSRGPKGAGPWKYAKHVYATPYKPSVKSAKATVSGQSTVVSMTWTAGQNASHPIDLVEAQYLIAVPESGMAAPAGESWTTMVTSRDTSGTDAATFSVDDTVGLDECLWVRTCVFHDENESRSAAYRVSAGKLTAPSDLSVTINSSTYRAAVSATNNSEVPDAKLAIVYKDSDHDPFCVGYIPADSTDEVTVQLPDFSDATGVAVGVYAYQGSQTYSTDGSTSIRYYTITANMISGTVWNGGSVPVAPSTYSAAQTDTEGEVLVKWNWSWRSASVAEISWSTNPNAWESTSQPSTYEVDNLYAAHWRVSDLALGLVWYFRVRLGKTSSDSTTWGPYTELMPVDLSSAPATPTLAVSNAIIPVSGSIAASWTYTSTDGTAQRAAELWEVTIDGDDVTYTTRLARVSTATSKTFTAANVNWATGDTHYIAVRVTSSSGRLSPWSDPVAVTIADPISITVDETSLETITITDDDEDTRSVTALTEMPLTATISGAGAGGTTTLVIERDEDYMMERPDESQFSGYEGETIFVFSQTGEDEITIEQEDLIGSLDDGAQYRLIATIEDSYGQTDEVEIPFEVHWEHQAIVPDGTVTIDDAVAIITPVAPEGYESGDVCDIYRLSVDKPTMVLEGAAFGTVYVDPYPAIGDTGGYRFVYRTANGDYITEDNLIAWYDVEAGLEEDAVIIDFDGDRISLPYNLQVSHSWEKDFIETTYLGGSIQGDWNLSVHRSTTASSDFVVVDDPEIIAAMRRLAVYPGICHVRTVDGSSFAADVQISESRTYNQAGQIAAFAISIKEVAPQGLDGMTYAEWETE